MLQTWVTFFLAKIPALLGADFEGFCAVKLLREDMDFSYVTLVCEDDQQIEAHKVILTAVSQFFQNLMMKNKHAHPLMS